MIMKKVEKKITLEIGTKDTITKAFIPKLKK